MNTERNAYTSTVRLLRRPTPKRFTPFSRRRNAPSRRRARRALAPRLRLARHRGRASASPRATSASLPVCASAAWSTSSEGPPAFGPEAPGAPEARLFAGRDVGGERETRIPRARSTGSRAARSAAASASIIAAAFGRRSRARFPGSSRKTTSSQPAPAATRRPRPGCPAVAGARRAVPGARTRARTPPRSARAPRPRTRPRSRAVVPRKEPRKESAFGHDAAAVPLSVESSKARSRPDASPLRRIRSRRTAVSASRRASLPRARSRARSPPRRRRRARPPPGATLAPPRAPCARASPRRGSAARASRAAACSSASEGSSASTRSAKARTLPPLATLPSRNGNEPDVFGDGPERYLPRRAAQEPISAPAAVHSLRAACPASRGDSSRSRLRFSHRVEHGGTRRRRRATASRRSSATHARAHAAPRASACRANAHRKRRRQVSFPRAAAAHRHRRHARLTFEREARGRGVPRATPRRARTFSFSGSATRATAACTGARARGAHRGVVRAPAPPRRPART